MLTIVHLTASPFLGGPERQMLGLARVLSDQVAMHFWSFEENGRAKPFLEAAAAAGFPAEPLRNNSPRYRAAVEEIIEKLRATRADLLLCHGYKSDLLGGIAARAVGIPVVAVSRGWTAATLKVRLNEFLDRLCLVQMDKVVCVSEGQAVKVRRGGVPERRIKVIRNAIYTERFDRPDPAARKCLESLFPTRPELIVGAAGRLSPEKGFGDLIEAAANLSRGGGSAGFVIFGDGPERDALSARIRAEALCDRFVLSPFRDDLDRLLPALDVLAMPSYTEGLPNVALEASAASVPIVATDVGGIPEVVDDGVTGYLVPSHDPATLASRLSMLLTDPASRRSMGAAGRTRIEKMFTFQAQGRAYLDLFDELIPPTVSIGSVGRPSVDHG